MAKRVLVTGAAGFIGSHSVESFLARGDAVLGLDCFEGDRAPARKHANLAELRARPDAGGLHFAECDIRNRAAVRRLVTDWQPDVILHLAAVVGVRASTEQPGLCFDVNCNGTLNLLEVARDSSVGHFVFASSSSVYGNSPRLPFREDDPADRPLAPYAASKRAAELLGHSYHHLHGLNVTALRLFTVYGPRNRPDMMAHKLADSIVTGQEIPLYEDGQMVRDFTFVSDTTAGLVAAVDHPLGFEIVNLGRGEPVLLLDFVRALESLAGRPARLVPTKKVGADASATHADIGKARQLLGYAPRTSLREGVERFWAWYERRLRLPKSA